MSSPRMPDIGPGAASGWRDIPQAGAGPCPYKTVDATMTSQPKQPNPWPRLFYSWAFGLLFGGLLVIGMHRTELGDLEGRALEEATVVQGILEIPSHTSQSTPIAIRDNSGFIWKCYIGYCGYKGVHKDLGKPAKAWILSGKVVQLEVDGVLKLSIEQRVAKHKNNTLGYIALVLAPLFGLVGFIKQRESSSTPENHSAD